MITYSALVFKLSKAFMKCFLRQKGRIFVWNISKEYDILLFNTLNAGKGRKIKEDDK